MQKKERKVFQSWLTKQIKDCIRSKEEAYKVGQKRPENWEYFRILQSRTKKNIKKGKIEFDCKLALNQTVKASID